MTSSDDSRSDGLNEERYRDEYEIMVRHTEEGFKYRKDVLTKLRRGNSGPGTRKGRADGAAEPRQSSKFDSASRNIVNLECEIVELKRKDFDAKNHYISRHQELETLRAHLDKLAVEISDYGTVGALQQDDTNHSDLHDHDSQQLYLKNQVLILRLSFFAFAMRVCEH
jgi:hypothetical protein